MTFNSSFMCFYVYILCQAPHMYLCSSVYVASILGACVALPSLLSCLTLRDGRVCQGCMEERGSRSAVRPRQTCEAHANSSTSSSVAFWGTHTCTRSHMHTHTYTHTCTHSFSLLHTLTHGNIKIQTKRGTHKHVFMFVPPIQCTHMTLVPHVWEWGFQ